MKIIRTSDNKSWLGFYCLMGITLVVGFTFAVVGRMWNDSKHNARMTGATAARFAEADRGPISGPVAFSFKRAETAAIQIVRDAFIRAVPGARSEEFGAGGMMIEVVKCKEEISESHDGRPTLLVFGKIYIDSSDPRGGLLFVLHLAESEDGGIEAPRGGIVGSKVLTMWPEDSSSLLESSRQMAEAMKMR